MGNAEKTTAGRHGKLQMKLKGHMTFLSLNKIRKEIDKEKKYK